MSAQNASSLPTPASRRQEDRSGATRARILDAAMACVAEEGFARTGLARIAARAGVSVGAIQHQYGGKEAVLLAVVERGFDELLAEVARLTSARGDLAERVATLVRALWARYEQPPARAALEILLQMRGESGFVERALPYVGGIRGAIDRMWMGHFRALPASRSQHVRAQRLLFTTLNGLTLEAALLPAMPDVADDLEILAEGIVRILDPVQEESCP